VALENYTRGQKIMFTAFIVLLAAMFTVTGSLTYVLGDKSKQPTHAGDMDGRTFKVVDFQHIRSGLRVVRQLDFYNGQGDEKPRAIYPRVPALSTMPQESSDTPYERSLLDFWPMYQDNDVWCHLALVQRAEAAGFVRPSRQAVWKQVTSLMNGSRQEMQRFKQQDLYKEFQDNFSFELKTIEPTLVDCLMVRDYVDSLLEGERARLVDIAAVVAGNHQEIKAQYMRLGIDPFMAQARAEIERENYSQRSAGAATGMGISGSATGSDACDDIYEKHRFTEFFSEATFDFEWFKAEFDDFLSEVPTDEKLERIYYEAMKKSGEFKATDDDKKNIDKRVEEAMNKEDARRRAADPNFKKFSDDEEKSLKAKFKTELTESRSFDEARPDIYRTLRKDKAPLYAQAAMASFKADLEREREDREKLARSQSALNQQRQRNIEALRSQRQDLRSRFDSIISLLNTYFSGAQARFPGADLAGTSDPKRQEILLSNLIQDLARNLEEDIGREQVGSLTSTAQRMIQDLDRQVRDKEARLEEQMAQKELKGPDGELMNDAQRKLEFDKIRLEIEGLKEQIKLRDLLFEGKGGKLEDSARDFADKFRKLLVGYKLALRSALTGEFELRKFAVEELMVEIPAELGRVVREGRDRIVPQAGIDDLDGAQQLLRADNEAFDARIRRESSSTIGMDLDKMSATYKIRHERFGATKPLTWREVLANDQLRMLENVEGAKRFLEEPTSYEGSVSEIMGLPDKGLYLFRLHRKTPRHVLGRLEANERVLNLAAMQRARVLCIREVNSIRQDILKRGWDAAIADAKKKWPQLEVKDTPWFSGGMDIPEVQSEGDSELLAFSSAPSIMDPDKPFVDRVKDIKPEEGVSEIIPEKSNRDLMRRPDDDKWAYMLARLTDRRFVERRMTNSDVEDTSYGQGPADIVRERKLAASATVLDLINPRKVLEKHVIFRYPSGRELEQEQEKSEDAANSAAK